MPGTFVRGHIRNGKYVESHVRLSRRKKIDYQKPDKDGKEGCGEFILIAFFLFFFICLITQTCKK